MNPFFEYFKHYRMSITRHWYNPFVRRVKYYRGVERISLPEAIDLDIKLTKVLENRTSSALFAKEPVSLVELSTLLHRAAGQYGMRESGHNPGDKKIHRPYPSGGAMYPLEIYLLIQNVPEVAPGLYHYVPDRHELEQIKSLDSSETVTCLDDFGYEYAKEVSVMLMFSFIKERSVPKYSYFAYKIGLIEAGHISQNMYLLAAALELQCCAFGGFQEQRLHTLLDIDGYNETLFYGLGISGKSPKESIEG